MALIRQRPSGVPAGDPDYIPFLDENTLPTEAQLQEAFSTMILSASGWRAVFAEEEESKSETVAPAFQLLAALAADTFVDFLSEELGGKAPALFLGRDARPSGICLGDIMARVMIARGCQLRYLCVVSIPELLARVRECGAEKADSELHADGFAYISASHNPIGHNGFKFGRIDGGVLGPEDAKRLIERFKTKVFESGAVSRAVALLHAAKNTDISACYCASSQEKRLSLSSYILFTRSVTCDTAELQEQEAFYDALQQSIEKRPLGIVIDFNGSARASSIDTDILEGLGIRVRTENAVAGEIAHRIVPEGSSLDTCKSILAAAAKEDPSYALAYMPDCDGDRGNIVIRDPSNGMIRPLEAQEVFALCCLAETAQLFWNGTLSKDSSGKLKQKAAIAINDPTSLRCDRIAEAFGLEVFRAEVGEANVVQLARKLREDGYIVRILGEGAAGGNITHPSAVRDPIQTVFAVLKLLCLRSTNGKPGLFELYCTATGQEALYQEDFDLSDILKALPQYSSTSAYEDYAILKIQSEDHGALKARYQKLFEEHWPQKKEWLLQKFGISNWKAYAYNGTQEGEIESSFAEAGRGGLKIRLYNDKAEELGFLWMRGSGTEPVFRVMAEIKGTDAQKERELVDWQRELVQEADIGKKA